MFTNNFKNFALVTAFASSTSYTYVVFKDITGSTVTAGNFWQSQTLFKSLGNYSLSQVEVGHGLATLIFGSSNESESIEDYNLHSIIDDTLFTRGASYVQYDISNIDARTILTQTVTYTGNDQITIAEVGYVYGGNNTNGAMLVAREVLSQPIVVNSGETFSVSMVID